MFVKTFMPSSPTGRGYHALTPESPTPPALPHALFARARSVRDAARLRQRWYGTPYAAVAPHVPPHGTVVDVGCGFGLFAAALAVEAPAREVVGLDLDAAKIDRGRRSFGDLPNLRLRAGDLGTAALPACAAVVAIDVLHHLEDGTVTRLLADARARLAPDGVLVIKENDTEPWWKLQIALGQEALAVGWGITASAPVQLRGREAWADLLREAGFTPRVVSRVRCGSYGDIVAHCLIVADVR